MKRNIFLTFLLLAMTAGMTNTANATKVKMVTFAGGIGHAGNGTHQLKVITGLPLVGQTINLTSGHQVRFGFWPPISQMGHLTPVSGDTPAVVTRLFNNYPNPFNPSTQIQFSLQDEKFVRVEIYDLKGRKVDTVFEGVETQGVHKITYQPSHLASGSYVILMRSESFKATQRITLVK